MELTFNELKKRDVINIADGKCLGRITDLKLKFPEGKLVGIFVPGRKTRRIFCLFDKSEMYIEEQKIIKIGGDVILVDIKCESSSSPIKPCPPQRPPYPPPCPAPKQPKNYSSQSVNNNKSNGYADFEKEFLSIDNERLSTDDY